MVRWQRESASSQPGSMYLFEVKKPEERLARRAMVAAELRRQQLQCRKKPAAPRETRLRGWA
jgi:hypothetical protein